MTTTTAASDLCDFRVTMPAMFDLLKVPKQTLFEVTNLLEKVNSTLELAGTIQRGQASSSTTDMALPMPQQLVNHMKTCGRDLDFLLKDFWTGFSEKPRTMLQSTWDNILHSANFKNLLTMDKDLENAWGDVTMLHTQPAAVQTSSSSASGTTAAFLDSMTLLTRATLDPTTTGQDPTMPSFMQRMGKLALPKVTDYCMTSEYNLENNLRKAVMKTKARPDYIPDGVQLADGTTVGLARLYSGLHAEKLGLAVPLKAEVELLQQLLTEHVELLPKAKVSKKDGHNYMYAVLDHDLYTLMMETGSLPTYRPNYSQLNWLWTPHEAIRHYAHLMEAGWEKNTTSCLHLVTFKMRHEERLKDFNRHYNEYSKFALYDMDYTLDLEELTTLTSWAFPTKVAKIWTDLADDFGTAVARDYTAWLNLETVIRDRDYTGDLSPGWEGQDWLKLYYYTMTKLPADNFDKLVTDFPFKHALELMKAESTNTWTPETQLGRATLEVYLDFFTHFQRRMKKMPFNNYTPTNVQDLVNYINSYFVPKYTALLCAKRSNL